MVPFGPLCLVPAEQQNCLPKRIKYEQDPEHPVFGATKLLEVVVTARRDRVDRGPPKRWAGILQNVNACVNRSLLLFCEPLVPFVELIRPDDRPHNCLL